jgi:alcohol dehydrogenase
VAAGLGCRFATAYRGIVDVARVAAGETVAVFGCGGVGLAAVMVARSRGARVVGVDVSDDALALAARAGADVTVDGSNGDAVAEVLAVVPDGADVAVDAVGSLTTASAATRSLRIRGRHLQIGLLPPAQVGDRATIPMHTVISRELTVLGSHGMPAVGYPRLLADVVAGRLDPGLLITRRIALEDAAQALAGLSAGTEPGVTVIQP